MPLHYRLSSTIIVRVPPFPNLVGMPRDVDVIAWHQEVLSLLPLHVQVLFVPIDAILAERFFLVMGQRNL